LGLAQRTLDDHWFEPGENNQETYYVPVAKAYLAAAKTLEPKGAKTPKARADLEGRLVKAGLTSAGKPRLHWTTEAEFEVKCSVNAEAGVPTGLPTVWFEGPKGKLTERETRDWPKMQHEPYVRLSEKNVDLPKRPG